MQTPHNSVDHRPKHDEEMVQLPFLPEFSLQKLHLYLVLFAAMFIIYLWYLRAFLNGGETHEVEISLEAWPLLFKFFIFAGWPFALVAFFNKDWSSGDAARIALAAFGLAVMLAFQRFGVSCFRGSALLFFPFLLSATICHTLGRMRYGYGDDPPQ